MDVAITREVFGLLLEMGYKFCVDKKELRRWDHYLQRLSAYRIDNDGALVERVDPHRPDVYNHGHLPHLYPVFPGSRSGKLKGDSCLIKTAGAALNKCLIFDTGSARGLTYAVLQAVWLEDIERVKTNLDRFCHRHYLYDGLITSHDPEHQVYNLNAISSFPCLLTEMLVYTEKGKIGLPSAWPHEYADGCTEGIRVYGRHTLDTTWKSGQLVEAVLHAWQNGSYEVAYRDRRIQLQLREGKTYYFSA